MKEKIIEEGLSVRETKALIKETIEQYSTDRAGQFEKIEKWLNSFDDSAIDHLNDIERSRLKQALLEKIQLLDRTPE